MTKQITFAEIEAALDAGKLELMRPWGDFIPVKRFGKTKAKRGRTSIQVKMEADVVCNISTDSAHYGYPDFRIAP